MKPTTEILARISQNSLANKEEVKCYNKVVTEVANKI